jgi:hypothetical protein
MCEAIAFPAKFSGVKRKVLARAGRVLSRLEDDNVASCINLDRAGTHSTVASPNGTFQGMRSMDAGSLHPASS